MPMESSTLYGAKYAPKTLARSLTSCNQTTAIRVLVSQWCVSMWTGYQLPTNTISSEHEEYLKQYCKEANDEWMKERGYKGNKWNNPVEEIGMLEEAEEGDDESERRRSRGI